jgi:heme A synthase
MEDVKTNLAVLWIVRGLAFLCDGLLVFYEPGGIETMLTGELYGMQLGDEFSLLLVFMLIVSLIMAVLSLNLNNSINKWVNIFVGLILIVVGIILNISMGATSISHYLVQGLQYLFTILIIWFAWKLQKD